MNQDVARALRRMAQQNAIGELLGSAWTREDVGRVACERALDQLGASRAVMYRLSDDASKLCLLAASGGMTEPERWSELRLDAALPIVSAVNDRKARFYGSLAELSA